MDCVAHGRDHTVLRERAALCVHFTPDRDEYSLWLPETDPSDASAPLPFRVRWLSRPAPVRSGEVAYGGTVVCDAVLLGEQLDSDGGVATRPAYAKVRDRLIAAGVPRQCAAILARIPERPLLATFGRVMNLPAPMVRRAHRLLLWAAS